MFARKKKTKKKLRAKKINAIVEVNQNFALKLVLNLVASIFRYQPW